jgi:hypothetical protein
VRLAHLFAVVVRVGDRDYWLPRDPKSDLTETAPRLWVSRGPALKAARRASEEHGLEFQVIQWSLARPQEVTL